MELTWADPGDRVMLTILRRLDVKDRQAGVFVSVRVWTSRTSGSPAGHSESVFINRRG